MIAVLIEPRPALVPRDSCDKGFPAKDVIARNNAPGAHAEMDRGPITIDRFDQVGVAHTLDGRRRAAMTEDGVVRI